jgi:hypothetical protein
MASFWKNPTVRKLGTQLAAIALREGSAFARRRGGAATTPSRTPQPPTAAPTAARPAPARTNPAPKPRPTVARPSAERARTIAYAPHLDGSADPGEVVWTWVEFEDDPQQGKDRPVLVVGREGADLLGLMLSSQAKRDDDSDWVAVGSGTWDREGRPSWVRLDRVLDVPEHGIRREGAILDRARFDAVAARLRAEHGWR